MKRRNISNTILACVGKVEDEDTVPTEAEEAADSASRAERLRENLRVLAGVDRPPEVTIEEMITNSDAFPGTFPIHTARLKTLKEGGHDKSKLEKYINSAYPLVHESLLPLLVAFLHHKRSHGSKVERKLYKDLDLLGLVDRLLKKRPLMFVGAHDRYLLRNGREGVNDWEDIGKDTEQGDLNLSDYMSYDEMKLSSLLCVSSHSVFINDGNRHNKGVLGEPDTFQPEGVIVGMVGARMHRIGVMEWQDCLITPEQNTKDRGYGKNALQQRGLQYEWGRLWGTVLPTWSQAKAAPNDTYLKLEPKKLFNNEVYKARMQQSAEILLVEAGARAKAVNMKAYVHVVGLGLGVWCTSQLQQDMFVDTWGEAFKVSDTSHVAHVDFSWISVDNCQGVKDNEVFPGTDVTLHFSRRALHAPIPKDTLLVTSYAWDGNSMPGNEYWMESLYTSGDPAAACSSEVAEIHNSLINPLVSAANLHIASHNGVEHVSEYAKRKLSVE